MEETRRLLGETLTHGGGSMCEGLLEELYLSWRADAARLYFNFNEFIIILLLLFEEYQSFGIKKNVEEMGI